MARLGELAFSDPASDAEAAAWAAVAIANAQGAVGYDPHPEFTGSVTGSAGPWRGAGTDPPGLFDDISFQNPFDSEAARQAAEAALRAAEDVGGVAAKLALALGVSLGIAQLIMLVGGGLIGLAVLKIYKG